MNKLVSFITLFVCFFFGTTSLVSGNNVTVNATIIDGRTLGSDLNRLEYERIEDGVVNYDNGIWAAVRLDIPKDAAISNNYIYLSYSLLDTVELWAVNGNGELEMLYQTGQAFPFDTRPYTSPDFIFPLIEGLDKYYFRIYSSKPVVLPFKVVSPNSLLEVTTTKDLLLGLYTGIMVVMFFYNLALLFITKDGSYLYYIIFLFTVLVAQLALFGYTDRFLTSSFPELTTRFAVITGASTGLLYAFFVTNFLQLNSRAPFHFKLIIALFVLELLGIFFVLIDLKVLAYHWVNFASIYGSAVGISAAVKLSKNGFKPAKFFLVAWSIFLTSVIIFALTNLGVLPYKPYFLGAMLIGSSIEVVLLSVALADRINVLKQEKEYSQKEALSMAKENERIVREQNLILEEKVQERTEQLQASNEELQKTLLNLNEAQAQLVQSEKMASLGVLTAGVAHEINNPLNYIQGGYTAMQDELNKEEGEPDKNELNEYLRWINQGVEKVTRIVKALNLYSRTNENLTEDCNLNSTVEDCLSILQPKIKDSAKITTQLSDNLSTVKGNSGKLHQVVLNILTNAIDALGDDGIIHIMTKDGENQVSLSIRDNGCGIPKYILGKVTDPFFTTKAPNEGTGLGLSISQSIVEKHHGKLEINSTHKKGTQVTITLPKNSVDG